MENYGKIRKMVIWLGVLFALNLVLIAFMMPKLTLWTVTALIVQVVIGIYLVGISLIVLKDADGKGKK